MKVLVTNAKAPWPDGVAVGSVVDVPGDALPGCLVGKCKPAPEDAGDAVATYEPKLPAPVVAETTISVPASAVNAGEDLAIANNLLEEARKASDQLTADLLRVSKERDEAVNDAAVAKAEAARLSDELAAATAKVHELEKAAKKK